jgi:16S rRNA (guanine527-N7)-methyltransferase
VSAEIAALLASRSEQAGISLSSRLADQLVTYYDVLEHWNQKINLTSLSQDDEAVDRLLLEPVAAARLLPAGARLIDLGSGGGSPAIPLALALSSRVLVMVESRSRKAAFLREALRELAIAGTVETERFESLSERPDYRGMLDLVSMRAVRADHGSLAAAAGFLRAGGLAAFFRTADIGSWAAQSSPALVWLRNAPLLQGSQAQLCIFEKRIA